MSVAIGYVPGAFGQGGDDPNFLRTLVELGDRYEYDSIWLSDRICSDRFSLEPMVALSLVAGYSDRLKFGTSVLALPLRNPVVLAKQVATLDWLSQGRFFPAVGLGQEDPDEYEACGVPKADRARRTDEAITLMRRLWEEEDVTHEGEFFTTHNVSVTPRTFLKPSPPVWIGGRSPAAARRVGRVGDGWLVSSATPEEVRSGREIVFETAQQYDREIEEDHVGVLIGYYICDDQKAGEEKVGAVCDPSSGPTPTSPSTPPSAPPSRSATSSRTTSTPAGSSSSSAPCAPAPSPWSSSSRPARKSCPGSTARWAASRNTGGHYDHRQAQTPHRDPNVRRRVSRLAGDRRIPLAGTRRRRTLLHAKTPPPSPIPCAALGIVLCQLFEHLR